MKEKNKRRTVRRVILEMKPIAPWLILGGVLDILAVLCAVAAPEILGSLVERLYEYGAGDRSQPVTASLLPGIRILLALYVGGGLLSVINARLISKTVSRHFTCALRIKMSDKIRRLPVKYVDQTPVGDVLNRMLEDVSEMSGYIYQIYSVMLEGFFQILLISAAMFRENAALAAFIVVLTPLSVWASSRLASVSGKHYDRLFEKTGELTEIVEECFSNFATTKAYHLESYVQDLHTKVNEEVRASAAKANFTGGVVQPLIAFSNALVYIAINLVGGWLMLRRGIGVGTVVTVILYARMLATPLEQIANGLANLNHIEPCAARVYEMLDGEEEPVRTGSTPRPLYGAVEFRDVCFSYVPEQPLIEHLNLRVEPGRKVAIVGPTGAGKTTIVNLLMGFYDINQGDILLDGMPMAQMSREKIRECFGMVLQDTWLFRGTVAENVAYGRPGASREEIEEVCRRALCDRFIRTMPQGYDTVIGEDTVNLSGGERQLLTIARAMLADRPLLILDEATSNVDTRTELLIQQAMDELMAGRTCFVIAHRLSTIVNADRILVMDHGKIVEQGTHRALLEKKGFYYRLYQSQYAV